ncbi:hypothetical protein [Pantoea sp.]|nr:hypothetical protein [Pantoea sp.]
MRPILIFPRGLPGHKARKISTMMVRTGGHLPMTGAQQAVKSPVG